jgi:hypothetical protein
VQLLRGLGLPLQLQLQLLVLMHGLSLLLPLLAGLQ